MDKNIKKLYNNYIIMYIIILGGENDIYGNLSNFTKCRINKFFEIYETYKNLNCKIIISGGNRFSQISHCEIVRNILLEKEPGINIAREFIENNNTIDESINISNYFNKINYKGDIFIITSNWHAKRSKYLFNITFKKNININLHFFETNETEIELELLEEKKYYNLIKNPYGKWLDYINEINSN